MIPSIRELRQRASSLLSSASFVPMMLLAAAFLAYPAEFKCPSYSGKHPLASASVFDGPPEEKADLKPDVIKGRGKQLYSTWDVGYLSGSGRNLFLVCRFAQLPESQDVTVKVDQPVKQCVFRAKGKDVPVELTCK